MIKKWPHKWFGFWREFKEIDYSRCPSIYDWIDSDRFSQYKDLQQVLTYLRTAQTLRVAPLLYSHIITGERLGGFAYKTDGTWVWPNDLADYIRNHKVVLPEEFYAHIRNQNYMLPDPEAVPTQDDIDQLDFPPVG